MRSLTSLSGAAAIALLCLVACGSGSAPVTDVPLVATDPPADAVAVRLRRPVRATLAEPMDPARCDEDALVLHDADGGRVRGAVECDASERTVTFKPADNLAPHTRYTATLGAVVAGVALESPAADTGGEASTWSFTTGAVAAITPIYAFDGENGADPKGSLTLVSDASGDAFLYGRTAFGGSSWSAQDPTSFPGGGVLFAVPLGDPMPSPCASPGPAAATYSFTSSTTLPSSGYQPHHDSMTLVGATLYGAALFTGPISLDGDGLGTLFRVDTAAFPEGPTAAYDAFHDFAGPTDDGAMAHSCFATDDSGTAPVLYGATAAGGANGNGGDGTLFCYDVAAQTYSGPLYSFAKSSGSDPHGRPTVVNYTDASGTPATLLVGLTKEGGQTSACSSGFGVVYAFQPPAACAEKATGTYTPLHTFCGAPDGATTDHGNLVVDTTSIGATSEACPAGAPSVTLYGMTTCGGTGSPTDHGACAGATGSGVIFRAIVTLPQSGEAPQLCGTLDILHNFGLGTVANLTDPANPVPDGYSPYGSPLLANGCLYGMTKNGGAAATDGSDGGGVLFMLSVDPSCAIAGDGYGVLASFDDPSQSTSGSSPIDNVILSADGSTLYGMTQSGGCNDPTSAQNPSFGTVFSIPSAP